MARLIIESGKGFAGVLSKHGYKLSNSSKEFIPKDSFYRKYVDKRSLPDSNGVMSVTRHYLPDEKQYHNVHTYTHSSGNKVIVSQGIATHYGVGDEEPGFSHSKHLDAHLNYIHTPNVDNMSKRHFGHAKYGLAAHFGYKPVPGQGNAWTVFRHPSGHEIGMATLSSSDSDVYHKHSSGKMTKMNGGKHMLSFLQKLHPNI